MAEANDDSKRQHQQLLLLQHKRQLFLLQQQQQQLLQQQQQSQLQQRQLQQQQQQQHAISRFPSNVDAHLRAPGLRPPPPSSSSLPPPASNRHHQHHPLQPQPARPAAPAVGVVAGVERPRNPVEVQMAQKDALMVCNPDFKRPFASVEDAVLRLLPYHVVSDYEAEEDDRILDGNTTGHISSHLQQWDHNVLAKIQEFTNKFEKQVLAFNMMSQKRAIGEFRSEERLMLEHALLQEEKRALLKIMEIESREKAGREAAQANMQMVMFQAEHARAEALTHAEMYAHAPVRASAAGDEGSGHDMGQEQGDNVDKIHSHHRIF